MYDGSTHAKIPMTPDRFRQIRELYDAARENPAALNTADAELRREVESLLQQEGSLPTVAGLRTATQASAGTMLGPYRIEAPLGAGGMGEVFRAVDTRLGRSVAIKICAAQFNERFEREARAVAALNHPNICTLHDVGPDYLVMELVEGEELSQRIGRGAIPLDEALPIARQIAEALEAAH